MTVTLFDFTVVMAIGSLGTPIVLRGREDPRIRKIYRENLKPTGCFDLVNGLERRLPWSTSPNCPVVLTSIAPLSACRGKYLAHVPADIRRLS